MRVHAQAAELDQLLELDGERRHCARVANNEIIWAVVDSILLGQPPIEIAAAHSVGVEIR